MRGGTEAVDAGDFADADDVGCSGGFASVEYAQLADAESLEPRIADMLERVLRCAIVGGPAEITAGLEQFITAHRPDEIMVTAQIYDASARRRSYEILAEIHAPPGTNTLP